MDLTSAFENMSMTSTQIIPYKALDAFVEEIFNQTKPAQHGKDKKKRKSHRYNPIQRG